MSAKDRILGIELPKEENKEEVKPAQNTSSPQEKKPVVSSYDELLQQLYPKPDKKQLEKRAKHARTKNLIAALGDGVSTIANLVATFNGAPNMDTGKNTLSSASQVRYDKLLKNYKDNLEKYRQGRLKGLEMDWKKQQADLAQSNADRAYNFEQSKFDYTKARHDVEDKRYNKESEYREKKDKTANEQWQKTYDLQKQAQDDTRAYQEGSIQARRERAAASNASARGRKLGFSDGAGNKVTIYENVWKASYPTVFEQLVNEGIGNNNGLSLNTYQQMKSKMTPREKMEFVMQNWHKSETATAMMKDFSQIDPALDNMEMSIEDYMDSDFSEYEDIDFSEYEI